MKARLRRVLLRLRAASLLSAVMVLAAQAVQAQAVPAQAVPGVPASAPRPRYRARRPAGPGRDLAHPVRERDGVGPSRVVTLTGTSGLGSADFASLTRDVDGEVNVVLGLGG